MKAWGNEKRAKTLTPVLSRASLALTPNPSPVRRVRGTARAGPIRHYSAE